ncbi:MULTISPECIES: SDR family NAD(P)-dependent oxidoreductase [Rhodomicrobium]|uniref:SDR family NAD(P)-dependent oxidoreductase n=1 Tax=Rhodomicrobium TaxID=1068 RepID=UPI000B4A8998|nr:MULTISPECIES: SDR family NAD(P)-dependent oxidoreductase [Rhodomicrobium]
MKVAGSVALVTGANRGLGRAYAEELLKRGAKKIYVGARSIASLSDLLRGGDERLVPLELDVADPGQVAAAARLAPDVNLLINNAGFDGKSSAFTTFDLANARKEMEVNYFGLLSLVRAFEPALAAAGGGAVVNVLSMVALVTLPVSATYSASKSAALAVTRSLRAELAAKGTTVMAVMPVQIETEMGRNLPEPRLAPAEVAADTFDALEAGLNEVFPGQLSKKAAEAFAADPKAIQARFSTFLPA